MAALRPDCEWWPAWRADPVLDVFDLEDRADKECADRDRVLHPVADDKRIGWQKEDA